MSFLVLSLQFTFKLNEMEKPMIYGKMIAVLQDVSHISKDKKNVQQGFNFRGIDQVMNELHGLFSKHGIFVTSKVLNASREDRATKSGGNLIYSILDLEVTFYAEDGSNVSSMTRGESMDSADKATNKAMSVALKYALLQAFMIPTEEMKDPDKDTPPPSAPIVKKPVLTEEQYNKTYESGVTFMQTGEVAFDVKESWYYELESLIK
jgi:ERF superfamily